jgi:hypothetical protein
LNAPLGEHASVFGGHGPAFFFDLIESCDAGQDFDGFDFAGGSGLIELTPCVRPTPYFDDPIFPKELVIAVIGIGVDIALVIPKEINGALLAPVVREVKDRKRRIYSTPHIDPELSLLDLAVSLDLKRDGGVIREDHIAFKHCSLERSLKGPDRLISLKDPACLGGPGDIDPLSGEDPVLAVKG